MADVKQMKKICSLISCEIPFCQYVFKLVFGVNIYDVDLWFQVDSVEQPINRNSVGSGHVSHCWTSSFDNHLDDSFVVLKNVQLLTLRRMCVLEVRNPHLTIAQTLSFSLQFMFSFCVC